MSSLFTPEQIENIRKLWGDDLFRDEYIALEPIRHTARNCAGNDYGPNSWHLHTPISWIDLVRADSLGSAYRHLRAYVLIHAMFDALKCDKNRPLTVSKHDSGYVGITLQTMNRTIAELHAAGLLEIETHTGRKTRVKRIPRTAARRKTCRNIWFPPISHISVNLPGVSVLAYLFLTTHLVRNQNRAVLPKNLTGWVKSRREFYKGTAALAEAGIIRKETCREYTLPVLFTSHSDVEIKLGTATKLYEDLL